MALRPAPDFLDLVGSRIDQLAAVYRDGRLQASSTRELFDSGLLPPRLDGKVQKRLVDEGLPYLVDPLSIGPSDVYVAYAPVRRPEEPGSSTVIAVPLVLEQRQIARALSRVADFTEKQEDLKNRTVGAMVNPVSGSLTVSRTRSIFSFIRESMLHHMASLCRCQDFESRALMLRPTP